MQSSKIAQDVLGFVQRRAALHGHTGVIMAPSDMQKAAKTNINKWSGAQFEAFKRQLSGYLLRTPAYGQPWHFKIYGPDVDIVAEERLVLAAFSGTALNVRFIDVAPDLMQCDMDVDFLADEVLYHVANNESISIITAKETDTKARRDMIYHAIVSRGGEPMAVPSFMSIHRLLAQTRPHVIQRSVIIVDNAHLLGSLEWAKLVRMTTKTTTLVGCSFFEGRSAGITLRRLFPMSTGAFAYEQTTESRYWLSGYLILTLFEKVRAFFSRVADVKRLAATLSPQQELVVICSNRDKVGRYQSQTPIKLIPVLLNDVPYGPATREHSVAVETSALEAFTVAEWVHFLCVVRRPCVLLKLDNTRPDPDLNEYMLTAASVVPRVLAADLAS